MFDLQNDGICARDSFLSETRRNGIEDRSKLVLGATRRGRQAQGEVPHVHDEFFSGQCQGAEFVHAIDVIRVAGHVDSYILQPWLLRLSVPALHVRFRRKLLLQERDVKKGTEEDFFSLLPFNKFGESEYKAQALRFCAA